MAEVTMPIYYFQQEPKDSRVQTVFLCPIYISQGAWLLAPYMGLTDIDFLKNKEFLACL